MEQKSKFNLFEAVGIELEYMIVDCDTLKVRPITDLLFFTKSNRFCSDVENGEIDWSNELANHLVELKMHKPVSSLVNEDLKFMKNIHEINSVLKPFNAMLLSTGMHPLMDPVNETFLWQHENKEIYSLYNSIFNCRSHGWANLQSMHINMSFANDEEFSKLHSAIRLLLPIIPAITASSPVCDGGLTGWADSRMKYYLENQNKMHSLMGRLIPEPVMSEEEYYREIFNPIINDISLYDKEGIMDPLFLNSRGAIARFDRGAIEIRIVDLQECPAADLAIATLITEMIRMVSSEKYSGFQEFSCFDTDELFLIFKDVIRNGHKAVIENSEYLKLLGFKERKILTIEIWRKFVQDVKAFMGEREFSVIQYILQNGSLSHRIISRMGGVVSQNKILSVYNELAQCLEKNTLFE